MKDLRNLKYFFGIEISRFMHKFFFSQWKYFLDLLLETSNLACAPVDTIMEVKYSLIIYLDQVLMNKERYQMLVRRLIHLSHTRPNISCVISIVSQFIHNSSDWHMSVVNRILVYLKFF